MSPSRPVLSLALAASVSACALEAPFAAKPGDPANPAPPGATKLAGGTRHTFRAMAVSPDKRHIAYMIDNPFGQLHMVTVGGGDEVVADLKDDVDFLRWADGGQTLVFQTVQREVIPGEFFDFDLPATRIVSARLQRVALGSTAVETLMENKVPVWFDAGANGHRLFFGDRDTGGYVPQMRVMDLATKEISATPLKTGGLPQASPDGTAIAWLDETTVHRTTVATGEEQVMSDVRAFNTSWLDADRLFVTCSAGPDTMPRMRIYGRGGALTSEVAIGGTDASVMPVVGKGGDGTGTSPDGKWGMGGGKGQDPGTPFVSLETGEVRFARAFAWRNWLDETTLLGVFDDGLYSLPFAQAVELGK